eukprot:scaffold26338_cov49-Attheya_sp.AAC.9
MATGVMVRFVLLTAVALSNGVVNASSTSVWSASTVSTAIPRGGRTALSTTWKRHPGSTTRRSSKECHGTVRHAVRNARPCLFGIQSKKAHAAEDDEDDLDGKSLEEFKAELSPLLRGVAGAVEVGVVTGGSYLTGAILGGVVGSVMGAPNLVKGQFGQWKSKAWASTKSWGELSAAFSGFHAVVRVCRGGVEDRWNGIVGSGLTGAYLARTCTLYFF